MPNNWHPHSLRVQAAPALVKAAPAPPISSTAMDQDEELDPELAEALRMSMQQDDGGDAAVPTSAPATDVRPLTGSTAVCGDALTSACRE